MPYMKLATKFNAHINPSTKLITLPSSFNYDATLDHESWPKETKYQTKSIYFL